MNSPNAAAGAHAIENAPTETMRTSPSRLLALDLFRFLAAVSVTAYHYAPLLNRLLDRQLPFTYPLRYGYLGVELFFIISGFVIALSIQGRTTRSFLVHRVVRLYPTFWLGLACATLLAMALANAPISTRDILANVTMLPGYFGSKPIDDVYWTLGVEWKFYFVMSVLLATSLYKRLDVVCLLWCVTLTAVHLGADLPGLRGLIMYPYGAQFAFGVLVMDCRQRGWNAVNSVAVAAALPAMLLATHSRISGFIPDVSASDPWIVGALMLLIAGAFGWLMLTSPAALEVRAFKRLGASTYPLYLLHTGVGSTLMTHWRPLSSATASIALSLAITMTLVILTTMLIEERWVPSLSKSELIRRLAGPRPTIRVNGT